MNTPIRDGSIRSTPLPEAFPGADSMDEEEVAAAVRVCKSKSLYRYYGLDIQHEADQFEKEFASYIGVKHALAVTSGTAGLHVALSALQLGPGDEVIVPAYMWVSVIAAVVHTGAIPVLAEIDQTFCLNPADVEHKITPRTAAILAVHMNGCAADIDAIAEIARRHHLFLIEDCAQCVGGSVEGRRVGTFGDIAMFSFQLNKNMTSGEAGAVVTNNTELYRRAIASHDTGYGRDDAGEPELDNPASYTWGFGVRLDELRAAVLRVQLRKLESTLTRMRASKRRFVDYLCTRPEVTLRQLVDPSGDTGGFLLTTFTDAESARSVNEIMLRHGIASSLPQRSNVILSNYGMHIYFNIPSLVQKRGTDRHGSPWTLAENSESQYSYSRGACPKSDDLFERTQILVIPSSLTSKDEDDILQSFQRALDEIFGEHSSRGYVSSSQARSLC